MTAPIGPDEQNSISSRSTEIPEQSESLTAIGHEANYVPEREFVLMPLFRRIGYLLGLRRHAEDVQYVDEVEAGEPQTASCLEGDSQPYVSADIEPAEPWMSAHREPQSTGSEATDDGAPMDSSPLELPAFAREAEGEPPRTFSTAIEPGSESFETIEQPEFEVASNSELQAQPYEDEQPVTTPALTDSGSSGLELVHSRLSSEEARELIAPLREAATKISAAIAQAADWLRTKEEEILQRRQSPTESASSQQVPSMEQREAVEQVSDLPLEAHTLIASTPAFIPVTEPVTEAAVPEAPALQRELAWRERQDASEDTQLPSQQLAFGSGGVAPAPQTLRSTSARCPFWKRIDWAEQFTPKRVAVLGGLAMAMLLVLGISLARRPAASVLPQHTKSIEPGGVTVSSRPRAQTAAPAAQPPRRTAATKPRPIAPPAQPRVSREASYDDGPEVVTHYYKPKPTPSKQATVAGVRHYSDMD